VLVIVIVGSCSSSSSSSSSIFNRFQRKRDGNDDDHDHENEHEHDLGVILSPGFEIRESPDTEGLEFLLSLRLTDLLLYGPEPEG
jgi:hypothetical protein